MCVLKVGMTNVGFEPFAPQREAPGYEFPPVVGHCARGGVYGEIVVLSLLPASVSFSSCLLDM